MGGNRIIIPVTRLSSYMHRIFYTIRDFVKKEKETVDAQIRAGMCKESIYEAILNFRQVSECTFD